MPVIQMPSVRPLAAPNAPHRLASLGRRASKRLRGLVVDGTGDLVGAVDRMPNPTLGYWFRWLHATDAADAVKAAGTLRVDLAVWAPDAGGADELQEFARQLPEQALIVAVGDAARPEQVEAILKTGAIDWFLPAGPDALLELQLRDLLGSFPSSPPQKKD